MSAFPDIPSDLVEWAARTGRQPDAQAFLPRRDYAEYLREALDRLADDRLQVQADRVVHVEPLDGGGFRVASERPASGTATGVITATATARRGLVAPDPLRLGVDCTPDGEVLDLRGAVVPGLFVVGPPRKGVLWEATAVPEIRAQAAALAARLPERVRLLRAG